MRPIKPKALRLRAIDAADYEVVSACLQDALMPVREMAWLPREHRFVAVFDRFMWEHCAPVSADLRKPPFVVTSALRVEGVARARLRGVDPGDRGAVLELLALGEDDGALSLVFAGGGAIRLEGEAMTCVVEDLADPRPARVTPHHDEAAGGAKSKAGGGKSE